MTDREYLELAAKAAGIELWHEDVFTNGLTQKVSENGILRWNPITDDGDAFRLAVRLKIDVAHTNIHSPQVHALADAKVQVWEDSSTDPHAAAGSAARRAARRAIVRAAAEIGRSMK